MMKVAFFGFFGDFWLFQGTKATEKIFLTLGQYFLSLSWLIFQPEIARIAQDEEKGFFGCFWRFLALFGYQSHKKKFSHLSLLFLSILRVIVAKKQVKYSNFTILAFFGVFWLYLLYLDLQRSEKNLKRLFSSFLHEDSNRHCPRAVKWITFFTRWLEGAGDQSYQIRFGQSYRLAVKSQIRERIETIKMRYGGILSDH